MSPAIRSPLERQQIAVTSPENQTYWHRIRFELVAADTRAHGARSLLDFGAGSGLLGDWIAANRPDIRYQFSELSPVLDEQLGHRFGDDARVDAGTDIDSSTAVAMLDVLEHIEDDRAVLDQLFARMQPGGRLIVTVPALPRAFTSWDTELGHFRRYTRRSLRSVVDAAGFRADHCSYLFPELLPLLVVRKLRTAPRSDVDFPHLPRPVAAAGYAVARATSAARRIWPLGTSVLLTATRP